MRYWISLRRGASFASSELVAWTADPVLARQAIAGLLANRVLEDDREDVILAPDFIPSAQAALAGLDGAIRRPLPSGTPEGNGASEGDRRGRRQNSGGTERATEIRDDPPR